MRTRILHPAFPFWTKGLMHELAEHLRVNVGFLVPSILGAAKVPRAASGLLFILVSGVGQAIKNIALEVAKYVKSKTRFRVLAQGSYWVQLHAIPVTSAHHKRSRVVGPKFRCPQVAGTNFRPFL